MFVLLPYQTITTMKAEIQKEIQQLEKAYKANLISNNDYCTMLHTLLKKLNNSTSN